MDGVTPVKSSNTTIPVYILNQFMFQRHGNESCGASTNSFQSPEKCSVCLTAFETVYSSEDPDEIVIQTRCKHLFHENCLHAAKMRKAECPLCRSQLTPLEGTANSISAQLQVSNQERFDIIEAAQRGRNAVRLALMRGQNLNSSQTISVA